MSILVDTNVLLRVAQAEHPDHAVAISALVALREKETELCLVPQVIYEYWVVATRPVAANGLGMTVAEAERAVKMLVDDFSLRLDERGIFGRWHALVTKHEVKGKNAHDARLAAAMQRHHLTQVLTFNTSDFSRFDGIDAISPAQVLAGAASGGSSHRS
jgi:predicted nucleic acid-binding protein